MRKGDLETLYSRKLAEDFLGPLQKLDLAILKGITGYLMPTGGINSLAELAHLEQQVLREFPELQAAYDCHLALAASILASGADSLAQLGQFHPDWGTYYFNE